MQNPHKYDKRGIVGMLLSITGHMLVLWLYGWKALGVMMILLYSQQLLMKFWNDNKDSL